MKKRMTRGFAPRASRFPHVCGTAAAYDVDEAERIGSEFTRLIKETTLRIVPVVALLSIMIPCLARPSSTSVALAAPTPLPGGANQVKAQSGVLGQTVWNGAVRLTLSDFRDATPEETAAVVPSAGKKVVVFVMKIRNGQNDAFIDLIEYTLADKDDVAVSVPTGAYTHANLNILQGAAQVQKAEVTVDQDFVPVKLIAQCVTCGAHSQFKTVRFSIPAPAAN